MWVSEWEWNMNFSTKNFKQKRSINRSSWGTHIGYWDQTTDPFHMYKLGVWGDIYAFSEIFVSRSPLRCASIVIWGIFASQNCMSKPPGIQCGHSHRHGHMDMWTYGYLYIWIQGHVDMMQDMTIYITVY